MELIGIEEDRKAKDEDCEALLRAPERDGELLLRRQLRGGRPYSPAHYFDYFYGTSTGG